uniref:BTB domain-containing protein n=1 Tax=Mycena chlorophos TaxID=658473 RepID=A0ABQ0L9K1_MYCCL|nr:predicted protein [Mycena chlorophos]
MQDARVATSPVRPAKRPRSESISEIPPPATGHPEFYLKADPLCVIRVENTIFKVHRYLLTQASPVFASMFELPQGDLCVEGTSEEAPIVLAGDSAKDFGALMKYLYEPGRNLVLQDRDMPASELQAIFGVARLAHKYEMITWQAWAGRTLRSLISLHGANFSSEDLVECFELSYKLPDKQLAPRVSSLWVRRIVKGELPIVPALDAGEAHNRRSFLSNLYEHELRRLPASPTPTTPLSFPGFKPIHIQRIFVGNWSLNASWTAFVAQPINIRAATCVQQHIHDRICVPLASRAWKDAVSSSVAQYPNITGLSSRLAVLQRVFSEGTGSTQAQYAMACRYTMSQDPQDPFVKAMNELSNLVNHFYAADPKGAGAA